MAEVQDKQQPVEVQVQDKKDADARRLYASNLKWELTDEELKKTFEEHGKVEEARIVRDKRFNRSRGYGFITFEKPEDAQNALKALQGKDIMGRQIRLELARSTGPTQRAPGAPGDAFVSEDRPRGRFRSRRRRFRRGFRSGGVGGGRGFRGRGRRGRGRGRGGYGDGMGDMGNDVNDMGDNGGMMGDQN